ncbi:unnamed protein product [Rhizoctonia solani]|uniref:Uncharacterized protein n=1 Tax=Rhizoctonia solani TaxID=456999 RepID=A0A8H3GQP3_9AGAM|nr:unnamed protein product [Rhizoctonia solani]
MPQVAASIHSATTPKAPSLDQQSMWGSPEPRSPTPDGTGHEQDINLPNSSPLPHILENYRPPAPPGGPERSINPEDNIDPDLLAAAEELDREYPFNELVNHPEIFYNDPAGYLPEDIFDDINFGLPDGQDLDINALPGFSFPNDIESEGSDGDPDEDPEPNVIDDPNVLCAAFREPDLIRNAYIDAFVQKTLYKATHQALAHQLKASRRTISAHPGITIDHIASMAQTIVTVERWLGINTD